MTTAHSPLPWKNGFLVTGSAIWSDEDKHVVSLSDAVPTEREKADAALIVRAVNAHDAMKLALDEAAGYVEEFIKQSGVGTDIRKWAEKTLARVDAALSLASGKEDVG